MKIENPAASAKFTKAIRQYLAAKRQEEEAKAAKKEAVATILETLDGDDKILWTTDDKSAYQVTAIYGKTSKTLNKDLVEQVLGVKVTDECFKVSNPWDEIRITIKA